MATTEGLTLATTLAISGKTGALLSMGGVQLDSMGVVEVGGELGDGAVGILGSRQLLPRRRHKTKIRQVSRYFMFILFIDKLLTLPLVIIIASEY
jgi:hypothetical protein